MVAQLSYGLFGSIGLSTARILRYTPVKSATTGRSWEEGSKTLLDDASLIEQARQGDEVAFAAIYDHFQKPIYAFIYRLMGNSEDAYDITQDVFVKAYRALPKTTPDLNLSAWLHRIASNACMDILRRRKIVRWLPWDPAVHANITPALNTDEPEYNAELHETRQQVQLVLSRMSEKYRLCLVLREYQDMSCDEIAVVIGTSRAAVKSLLFRAREQFREIYTEFDSAGWKAGIIIKAKGRQGDKS
ncbi:sigma-70 family RNA polymerase sigma factor [Candidatus Chlorohelix sp.]|uniref:RNA polymerase sigma factor n=1 Tax=Candidatus Chlorohelix sp. TaxID=3139201 RepID=UPI0030596F36